MLRIERCTVGYADQTVFSDLTLAAAPGETLAVVGPSGCGKSTLLYAAAGLLAPHRGTVALDGQPVAAGDRRVGLVLQQYGLFPWFSVLENVALGLRLHGVPREERVAAAYAALDAVGMQQLAPRFITTLSGGQQQRVAIARTWAMQPRLLLMDEPFSALDALTRESLQDLLCSLLQGRRMVSILVTHSIDEAVLIGSRIGVMHGHPAKITWVDNPLSGRTADTARTSPEFFAAVAGLRRRFAELLHA
ncbi:MAG: ABC transporter ATP-binding protein [Spirochaetaceae bacterium]|nr:MAG: ABC transporter ATP-binding protein [Spirochaetaceae bacterium]